MITKEKQPSRRSGKVWREGRDADGYKGKHESKCNVSGQSITPCIHITSQSVLHGHFNTGTEYRNVGHEVQNITETVSFFYRKGGSSKAIKRGKNKKKKISLLRSYNYEQFKQEKIFN